MHEQQAAATSSTCAALTPTSASAVNGSRRGRAGRAAARARLGCRLVDAPGTRSRASGLGRDLVRPRGLRPSSARAAHEVALVVSLAPTVRVPRRRCRACARAIPAAASSTLGAVTSLVHRVPVDASAFPTCRRPRWNTRRSPRSPGERSRSSGVAAGRARRPRRRSGTASRRRRRGRGAETSCALPPRRRAARPRSASCRP